MRVQYLWLKVRGQFGGSQFLPPTLLRQDLSCFCSVLHTPGQLARKFLEDSSDSASHLAVGVLGLQVYTAASEFGLSELCGHILYPLSYVLCPLSYLTGRRYGDPNSGPPVCSPFAHRILPQPPQSFFKCFPQRTFSYKWWLCCEYKVQPWAWESRMSWMHTSSVSIACLTAC